MSRYAISVESKAAPAETLDEALSKFNGMMTINKQQVSRELSEKGESHQVYGFCTGLIRDLDFAARQTTCTDCDCCGEITIVSCDTSLCAACSD